MTAVTALTATRMTELEAASVVGGHLTGNNLILEKFNATTIDAGAVKGPTGFTGATGTPGADGEALSVGTYTPDWFAASMGNSGVAQNIGAWTFTGGPDVGDVGLLSIRIAARFGTNFQSFPSTNVGVGIPPAFNWATDGNSSTVPHRMSTCYVSFLDTSANAVYNGYCGLNSTTSFALWATLASDQSLRDLSTTIPFTWASGDGICVFIGGMRAIRV